MQAVLYVWQEYRKEKYRLCYKLGNETEKRNTRCISSLAVIQKRTEKYRPHQAGRLVIQKREIQAYDKLGSDTGKRNTDCVSLAMIQAGGEKDDNYKHKCYAINCKRRQYNGNEALSVN